MGHAVAALIALLFVAGTISLIVVDHVRTAGRRRKEACVKVELVVAQKKDEDSRRLLERKIDENLEEMETLKGLSGIQSCTGMEVRAALAAAGNPKATHRMVTDSQVARDFYAKAEEVMRLSKKAANG